MKSHVIKKGRLYWNDFDIMWGSLSSATIWKHADDAQDIIRIETIIEKNESFKKAKVIKVEINEIKK